MLTDKILKGINKAWGAGEADEELIKYLVDKHGFSREDAYKMLDYVGPNFIHQGNTIDTADKLVELVDRMTLEFTPAEVLEELGTVARIGEKMVELRKKSQPYTAPLSPEERRQQDIAALPEARQRWLEDWDVPESERGKWESRSLTHPTEAKWWQGRGGSDLAGWYHPGSKSVVSLPDPSTIAHEMAHANYYENMPPQMHASYPMLHGLARWLDPKYKEASVYGSNLPLTGIDQGSLPIEGYATSYGHLGHKQGEMPWYLEPFYGKLQYPVPNIPVIDRLPWVHVGSWAAEKVQQWAKDKLKDKKKATAPPTGGGGGGWGGGGDRHHELL